MKIMIKNGLKILFVTFLLSMNSCYDNKMEWNDPYKHPDIKDLPLELQEKIARYEKLNSYADFKLGVGIDFNLYMTDETYRNIINQNFDDITPGNEMKQSSVMNAKGELIFSVDNVIAMLKNAGLTIYGHTLVWHSQQQSSYLNSLIAPEIIPGTPDSSLIVNGDFEKGLEGWDVPFYKDAVSVTTNEAIDGTHSMKVAVGDWGNGKFDMQINSPKFPIIKGHKYEISFFIKSEGEGKVGLDFPNNNLTNQYPWTDGKELVTTTTAWTKVTYNPTTTPGGMVATVDNPAMNFRFLLGAVKNMTYYIDGVIVDDITAAQSASSEKQILRAGPVIIEKTPEEKEKIIGEAMESWISQMVGHYKNTVHAWDVINEPMNDNGSGLKTGEGKILGANEFYWQDYLGKDYAAIAFKLARRYGNQDDILFINDYNLESGSLSKLNGLIDYVKYIESKGAKVDGIGTQLHLNINWTNKENIAKMFEKLRDTGKLIKVTELDISISKEQNPANPISPTTEEFAQQADLYQYVVDMYIKYIPAERRFGITVWGVSDNEKEHQYWLKNDAPCLWDANYQRKHAYKGFADGLAGKDVSNDFSGELVY